MGRLRRRTGDLLLPRRTGERQRRHAVQRHAGPPGRPEQPRRRGQGGPALHRRPPAGGPPAPTPPRRGPRWPPPSAGGAGNGVPGTNPRLSAPPQVVPAPPGGRTPAAPEFAVQSVSVGEGYRFIGSQRLVFALKVADLT